NPWIFRHARLLLDAEGGNGSVPAIWPPSIHEQREALREHFAIAMQIHGEQVAGRRMRKMGIKYARFHPRAAEVKAAFIDVVSLRQWNEVLDRFYSADGPGVWPDPLSADEVNDGSCEALPAAG